MCSVAGHCDPRGLGFLYQRFSLLFATKPVRFEPTKQNVVKICDHSCIWDSWPIAFFGLSERAWVGCETECPRHAAPNLSAETRSRTECLENPTAPPEKFPEMERTRSETLKLFVVSDRWASKLVLSSTQSMRWWQSSWPR